MVSFFGTQNQNCKNLSGLLQIIFPLDYVVLHWNFVCNITLCSKVKVMYYNQVSIIIYVLQIYDQNNFSGNS